MQWGEAMLKMYRRLDQYISASRIAGRIYSIFRVSWFLAYASMETLDCRYENYLTVRGKNLITAIIIAIIY